MSRKERKQDERRSVQRVTRVAGLPADYPSLLENIKQRIRAAQVRATLSANAELIRLYWGIGRAIAGRQRQEGWGAAVIPRLARDLRNEMPEVKGFSERNLKYMIRFYREYDAAPIVQQPTAQLPWAQTVLLVQKVKDFPTRSWHRSGGYRCWSA